MKRDFYKSKNINSQRLAGKKIAVIKANFNEEITGKMLEEAKKVLEKYDVSYEVFEVKGSFEIIYALVNLLEKNKFAGFVPLGCLIKGETQHFEYIAENVSRALKDLIIKYKKSISFGILTCLNQKQAEERTGLGAEATIAVLESLCIFG